MRQPAELLPDFLDTQRRTIDLVAAVADALGEGMSERDGVALALQKGKAAGFSAWFHPPRVRFGGEPAMKPTDRARSAPPLQPGMIVEVELAPATDRAFGHSGLSFAFGTRTEPPILQQARDLCRAVVGYSSRWKCTGELFVFAEAWTNNRRGNLGGQTSVGYQVRGPGDGLPGPWPLAVRAWSMLRRNQVQYYNPRRMNGIYVVRPRAAIEGAGALFAEMILVTPEQKVILGRDSLDQVASR